jgi:hypothetical protein
MRTATFDQGLYRGAQPRFAFTATSPQEVRQWQAAFRPELRRALGLERMQQTLSAHVPTARQIDSQAMDGYVRESWLLEVEPQMSLPFYLLKPMPAPGPLPLVLTPHGHNHPHLYAGIYHDEAQRQHIAQGDRDIAVQAVKQGYLAIAPTTRGFGDTRTENDLQKQHLSSCRIQLMHGLLVGRTAIGERVWDIERLIDWALVNLPVDPARIAITGNSGGGTTTLFAAACDERIAVAMPGSYFCTFVDSIGSIHHCDCNYVPGLLTLGEMHDVAGLIAPRPFQAINGVNDEIFPIAATRRAYAGLRQVYQVLGVADRCCLYEGAGGHRFYAAGAWPFLRRFF